MVTEQQVLDALRGIMDPDLGRDIVSLGFIKHLTINNDHVSFTVELTTPACPMKARFQTQCEEAVSQLPGVAQVTVTMSAMTRPAPHTSRESTLEGVGAIIAVSSCKGGVGKSTVAALLARALQRQGNKVGLLDADIYGPSLPTLFHLHNTEIFMKNNLIQPIELAAPAGMSGLKLMSFGFLLGESPAVLRGPMVSGYMQQVLTQTEWGPLDYLIIDMPPGTGDIQLTITQHASLDGAIIVTTPQALSLADVAKGILMFERVSVPVLGLVENMSYFLCDSCGTKHRLFGASTQHLNERFGLTTLTEIPILPGISETEQIYAEEDLFPILMLKDQLQKALGARRCAAIPSPQATSQPGHLHILWPDGTENRLPNRMVRAACLCARCVDEYTGAQLLDASKIADDIQIDEVYPLGNYALSITWTDGHASGIYAWDHLKTLAQQTASPA